MQSFMILVTNKPHQSTASEWYASLDISVLLDAYSTEDARTRWSFHFRRVGNIHTTLLPDQHIYQSQTSDARKSALGTNKPITIPSYRCSERSSSAFSLLLPRTSYNKASSRRVVPRLREDSFVYHVCSGKAKLYVKSDMRYES
jgi:hypothetical protein